MKLSLASGNGKAVEEVPFVAAKDGRKDEGVSRKANNFSRANPISKLFFCWMLPTFVRGAKRELSIDEISLPAEGNYSKLLSDKLERLWFEEEQSAKSAKRRSSLLRPLVKAFFWGFLLYQAIVLFSVLLFRSVQPVILKLLLEFFERDSTTTLKEAYIYGAVLVLLTMVSALTVRHGLRIGLEFGMKVRIACSSLIYRKVLRMKLDAMNATAAGKVVNLLSNDIARFDGALSYLVFVVIAPLQILLVLYLMYVDIGWYAFIGMGSIVLQTVPLQSYLGRVTAKYRQEIAQRTDERVKVMNEIVSGIKVIKMYAWEKPFEMVVAETRKREMDAIRKTSYVRAVFSCFSALTERTSLYVTLLAYSLLGNAVSSALVFSFTSFLSIVRITLASALPIAISTLSETLVTIERIEQFLALDERDDLGNFARDRSSKQKKDTYVDLQTNQNGGKINSHSNGDFKAHDPTEGIKNKVAVEFSRVTAQWTEGSSTPTLSDITMQVRRGQLCAVIGSVGSGKSSLLQALLRELTPSSGQIEVNGSLSYASQEAWLFVDTIRQNILFGRPYDAQKYREVVRACALEADFRQIPRGDMALVGERGISLSGGQRSRINLARAVYRQADIYLLDDPLSAVDATVGRQLFENCINGYLKGSTRLLVTHQLHYLKSADLVIILNNGKIEAMGTFEDLASLGENFAKLLTPTSDDKEEADFDSLRRRNAQLVTTQEIDKKDGSPSNDVGEILEAEDSGAGGKHIPLYWKYVSAGNTWIYFAFVIFITVFSQVVASVCDLWVSYWTNNVFIYGFNSTLSLNDNNTQLTSFGVHNINISTEIINNKIDLDEKVGPLSTKEYLYVFTALIGGCIFLVIFKGYLFFSMCMKSSQGLHDKMFHTVLRGVSRFFDTNPSGRILNRFSKDIGQMDEVLPNTMMEALNIYLIQISIFALVAISLPWMLVTALILFVILYLMFKLYLTTGQAVKRIEGVSKSPIYSHLSATLDGMTTIRCYNAQDKCSKEFDDHQDIHTSAWEQYISAQTTLGWWLDFICSVYILIVVLAFLLIDTKIPPGYIGLAISQALSISGSLQYGVRQTTEVIALMINVERVLQYTKIKTEKKLDKGDLLKPIGWPNHGAISLSGTNLRYDAEKPPVLINLNIKIQPGWKVGIVGRTGAGKTSLIAALFRLAEIDGDINIDEIETGSISLQDLRSSISIIPQEPVLFSASVRYNLDPFNKYDDATLWAALEAVELKDAVQSLDFKITQGGSNFSVGQRQLICVARAIISNNKILILDEATANVDPKTDNLIQQTIRRRFFDCTVLTIAHRLNTIMDSDRVLVMNFGEMVEFDHLYKLLLKKNGYFDSMVSETGPITARQLLIVAKETYEHLNRTSEEVESDI